MKKRDLEKKIRKAAKAADLSWELLREDGDHEIWALDGTQVSIPRHTELNEFTAQGILRTFDGKLGKGWWR